MKHILRFLPAIPVASAPALAHDIEATHSHVGEAVLFHMSPLLILGAGIVALIAFVALRTKSSAVAEEDRHDSR